MRLIRDSHIPIFLILTLFVSFLGIGKTIDDLRRSSILNIKSTLAGSAGKFFAPRAGEDRLPPAAQIMIKFLRENKTTQYQLSPKAYDLVSQRIVEGAWPIRVTESAPARFYLVAEALPKNCKKKGEESGIVFALCL